MQKRKLHPAELILTTDEAEYDRYGRPCKIHVARVRLDAPGKQTYCACGHQIQKHGFYFKFLFWMAQHGPMCPDCERVMRDEGILS